MLLNKERNGDMTTPYIMQRVIIATNSETTADLAYQCSLLMLKRFIATRKPCNLVISDKFKIP